MNSIREWWKNKQKYMKALIIAVVFDLLALGVTFILNKLLFFIALILSILILIYFIPILYLIRLVNQPISSREYYLKTVKDHYMYIDENLLTKMFEIRISNQRSFLFAFLSLFMVVTLTLAFNPTAYNYFDNKPFIYGISAAKFLIAIGFLCILAAVYYAFGFDRETLKELEPLFNAKEILSQLKKANSSEENVEKQGEKVDILGKIKT